MIASGIACTGAIPRITEATEEETQTNPNPTSESQQAVAVEVTQALEEQDTLIESQWYCSVDADVLAALDRDVGDQVRVRRANTEGEYAIYTISEERDEDSETVRMGLDGRVRVGTEDPFEAGIDTTVPRSDLGEEGAEENDEFIEHLAYQGDDVIAISPHGGAISPGTDEQSAGVAERFPETSTRWGCKGWREGGGAFDRWFVAPTEISPASFPRLAQIYDRGFGTGVSFRGLDSDGVDVFGTPDGEFTEAIATAIEAVVGDDVPVETQSITTEGEAAYKDAELIDRLTADDANRVWLGQSRTAREDYGEEITTAVAVELENWV